MISPILSTQIFLFFWNVKTSTSDCQGGFWTNWRRRKREGSQVVQEFSSSAFYQYYLPHSKNTERRSQRTILSSLLNQRNGCKVVWVAAGATHHHSFRLNCCCIATLLTHYYCNSNLPQNSNAKNNQICKLFQGCLPRYFFEWASRNNDVALCPLNWWNFSCHTELKRIPTEIWVELPLDRYQR